AVTHLPCRIRRFPRIFGGYRWRKGQTGTYYRHAERSGRYAGEVDLVCVVYFSGSPFLFALTTSQSCIYSCGMYEGHLVCGGYLLIFCMCVCVCVCVIPNGYPLD